MTDAELDGLYPAWAQRLANVHWTPVAVAQRAAQLFELGAGERVLDVGAGVGKFCVAAALASRGQWVGVEQRLGFVELAREVAARAGASGAQFVHANAMALDWRLYQGIYLFNPFAEDLGSEAWGAGVVAEEHLSEPMLFGAYVRMTRLQLEIMPAGAKVVTYHGFGGEMPEGYELRVHEPATTDYLQLWVKRG